MTKKHSTGALSKEARGAQNKRYEEGHDYDYLIIGTGSAALTVGALLANAGHKICMLEAHDIPGGYLHSFKMADYYFCAQVHYIWGCGPGGKIYEFLKRIGLEKDITFEVLGPEGYDVMALPDGNRVKIPYGFDKLVEAIADKYPDQKESVQKFTKKLEKIRDEMRHITEKDVKWWRFIFKWWKILNLIRYRGATVQDLFDECKLSKEAQAILIAQAGDFMLPPNRLSIFAYAGLFGGYNTGAYYPTKHFKYYVERLVEFITEHDGCHIYYETEVTKINTEKDQVVSVETKDGKTFKAKNYICNMDPQTAANKLIGREKFPKNYLKKLDFEYSESGVMIYMGLKGIDLRKHGFGSYNIWHLEQWDMNKMWDELENGTFENPWIFMSTPTLHTDEGGTTPDGHHILEVAMYAPYEPFKKLQDEKEYTDYNQYKIDIAKKMLDIVKRDYIPNLSDHIAVQVIGSPVTNEDFCKGFLGNAYGSDMTPKQVAYNRLKAWTPWKNFWWCNASSGWAGVYGTVSTGLNLYMDLTGDRFYDPLKAPSDEEMIRDLNERIKREAAE